jgi:hypothetical protein
MSIFIWLSVFAACLAFTIQSIGSLWILAWIVALFATFGAATGAIIRRPVAGMIAGIGVLALLIVVIFVHEMYIISVIENTPISGPQGVP